MCLSIYKLLTIFVIRPLFRLLFLKVDFEYFIHTVISQRYEHRYTCQPRPCQ